MFTLIRTEIFSQDIKKSRFTAVAGPIASDEEAKRFLADHGDPGANHRCWAFRLGETYRFSDDGEPSGTAGKPILQAIDGRSIDGVIVVVLRWFGGILLGSGGLIRAYGGTAAACLDAAEKREIVPMVHTTLACGFSDLALVKAKLNGVAGVSIDREDFSATGATLHIAVPMARIDDVADMIRNATAGRVRLAMPR